MKQNLVTILFGLSSFFLVLSVLYSILFIVPDFEHSSLGVFIPLVVFTGFFIFLIGAMLVALSIFKWLTDTK